MNSVSDVQRYTIIVKGHNSFIFYFAMGNFLNFSIFCQNKNKNLVKKKKKSIQKYTKYFIES